MIKWQTIPELADYEATIAAMEAKVAAIAAGEAEEQIWLLEHPPLYTAGTSAKAHDLIANNFPVHQSGRGGQFTYHGPNQRIIYLMLNLKARYAPKVPDVRHFVHQVEGWIIDTLADFAIVAERKAGRIGIWVENGAQENKIAAIGIRISRGVSLHGAAINLNPDLSHYSGIIPCGIREYGVTSMYQQGAKVSMAELDASLRFHCPYL